MRVSRDASNLTILLIDDHDGFRSAARAELEAAGLEVIGELDRAASAVEQVVQLHPDVALLDIRLPDGDGVEIATRIGAAAPDTSVVLTSGMNADDVEERLAAVDSPAPFLPKTELSAANLLSIVNR